MTGTEPRFDPASVEAVVFDIGGVFLYPSPDPVRALLIESGRRADRDDPSRDDLVFRRAHHAGVRALYDSEQEVAEHHTAFWHAYDHAYLDAVGVPLEEHAAFSVAVRTAWNWAHPANIAAFHQLVASGMPTAIVSNNDGTAEDQLVEHNVCQVGEGPLPSTSAVVDSGRIGIAKPDPAIMVGALAALGQPPANVLYVGDTVHADVRGATNAGMQVVQLDPYDQHADLSHPRVADVAALVESLA